MNAGSQWKKKMQQKKKLQQEKIALLASVGLRISKCGRIVRICENWDWADSKNAMKIGEYWLTPIDKTIWVIEKALVPKDSSYKVLPKPVWTPYIFGLFKKWTSTTANPIAFPAEHRSHLLKFIDDVAYSFVEEFQTNMPRLEHNLETNFLPVFSEIADNLWDVKAFRSFGFESSLRMEDVDFLRLNYKIVDLHLAHSLPGLWYACHGVISFFSKVFISLYRNPSDEQCEVCHIFLCWIGQALFKACKSKGLLSNEAHTCSLTEARSNLHEFLGDKERSRLFLVVLCSIVLDWNYSVVYSNSLQPCDPVGEVYSRMRPWHEFSEERINDFLKKEFNWCKDPAAVLTRLHEVSTPSVASSSLLTGLKFVLNARLNNQSVGVDTIASLCAIKPNEMKDLQEAHMSLCLAGPSEDLLVALKCLVGFNVISE